MTELIWDGKYVDGKRQAPVRLALPFQTIETINESAADRNRTLEMFGSGKPSEWRNRLIWGDKKYVLPSLIPEFAGKVELVYIDPPFDTGADFSFRSSIPESSESFTKEPSILEQKAYRDTWGRGLDSYLEWFYETAVLLHELLSETGSIYVHIGPNMSHYVKAILDEVFGAANYVNEIVWRRAFGHSDSGRFGIIHDLIFLYGKSERRTWNPILQAPDADYIETFFDQYDEKRQERYQRISLSALGLSGGGYDYEYKGVRTLWRCPIETLKKYDAEGRLHWPKKQGGVPRLRRYVSEYEGVALQDIWTDIKKIHNQSAELVNYPTQKPEALLERIIKASSNEGELVLDCFIGSGTTAAVAEKHGRRWLACDLGRFAVHTSRKRLLSIPGVKPFTVQNLGKYERQAWQVAEFHTPDGEEPLEHQHRREKAYREFILDLYHATSVDGHSWLHGIKSGRMVHVGAVDAPVTLSDIRSIAREVWKASNSSGEGRKAAADILGWEFAFELNETARQIAAESRVDVAFKKIPREVLEKKAVEQGDIRFFELGALSVDAKLKKNELAIELTDFVIPIDDVPEEARKAVKHWSQMIDYWAVDWDFKDDTFHNQWQSYRTRQDPKIELKTKHEYQETGEFKVMVKVIDILGNDTTKTLDIKVK